MLGGVLGYEYGGGVLRYEYGGCVLEWLCREGIRGEGKVKSEIMKNGFICVVRQVIYIGGGFAFFFFMMDVVHRQIGIVVNNTSVTFCRLHGCKIYVPFNVFELLREIFY